MLRCSGGVLLPGSVFKDITKNKFHKSHHWEHNCGIPILAEATRPGIGGEPLPNLDGPPHHQPSMYPPHAMPKLPSWLAYDKQVLCFYGYFKETLQEIYLAPYLVRKVKILFYLEDGTMQVSEPRTDNSGIPQGCLVTRQRVPRPAPCQNEFLSVLDLNVNQLVQIFDRVYHITGSDIFTRHFLNKAGISVPDNIDSPNDPGTEIRNKMASYKQPKKPSVKVDTLGQFLENDRKVLRFNAYWNDDAEFGDVRDLMVYYFLADDTMQIKEILQKNSGRDSGGIFLKRGKLHKDFPGLSGLGQEAPYTVLNVLGGGLRGGRFMTDSLDVGSKKIDYYTDRDLTIGTTINVYSRPIVITGCDGFTQDYYRIKYGIEDFPQIRKPAVHKIPECIEQYERELPPFNGWGTHEDSQGNCKTVEPKPPRTDFNKFIKLDGYLLRFGAKMLSSVKENTERIFIITYFLSDDTISIYELAVRNSGFVGGDFYKRTKFNLPNQEILTSKIPLRYIPQHFFIGATLLLKDFKFHLVTADEFALTYMEQKSNDFPYSNINMIMSKIRDAVTPNYKNFVASHMSKVCSTIINGMCFSVICFEAMRDALIELLGDHIVEHEIITFCRYFSAEKKERTFCDREKVRSCVHMELKRMLWDNMDRLREHLYHLDPLNNPYMPKRQILTATRACRLPLDIELINNMFSVLFKDENGFINVCDFLEFIDVTKLSCPIQPLNIKRDVCPVMPFTQAGRLVDWNCFLDKLGLEQDLKNETD